MTTTNPLDSASKLSASVSESNEKTLAILNNPAPSEVPHIPAVISNIALINGLLLQQAALDVAIVNARAQERIAAAAEDQALSIKTLMEELSNLSSDVAIIAGQNAGGYSWSPQLSVEIANWGDQR